MQDIQQLEHYLGQREVPTDFDQFWDENLQKLPASFQADLIPKDFGFKGVNAYELVFAGTNHGTVYSRCLFPKDPAGPVPVVFYFHGYMGQSPDWSELLKYPASGFGIVAMDVRGQSGYSQDHASFNGNTVLGHIIRGAEDGPEHLFYKHIYLDVYSLVEIVAGFDFVDEGRLYSYGGSQGGALSLVAAALNPKIKFNVAIYPFLSDFKYVVDSHNESEPYMELIRYFKFHDPFHKKEEQILRTLDYIDIKNMAHRVQCPVRMITGMMDDVCMPATQFAIYNRLGTADKQHFLLPEYEHEPMNVHVDDQAYNWLCHTKIQIGKN